RRYLGQRPTVVTTNLSLEALADRLGERTVSRLWGASLVVNELPYNLISRAIEAEIMPFCEKRKIGIFGYMALQQGILAGMYKTASDVPPPQAHSRHFKQERGGKYSRHGGDGCEAEVFEALEQMKELASQNGLSLAELSISWCIANPLITSTLVGTTKVKKLRENARIVDKPVSSKLRDALDKITAPVLERLGNSPDYYEPLGKGRIF
ncbi:MAG: aldo/keto reductase, partial [Candidatus Hodarchaeota archaeon]